MSNIVAIRHRVPAYDSYAAERTRGLYNIDVADGQRFELDVEMPDMDGDWQIGVVVGPSGSGKTSIASYFVSGFNFLEWFPQFDEDRPIIEVLDAKGDYAKATAALAAVGLGSVPSWLRPFHVLSNGEQFRASLAELILDTSQERGRLRQDARVLVDEFTSVLDRQVARVGAGAFAKAWRRQPLRKIVLVTPHYDILDWVEPDWVIDTHGGETIVGDERKVVRPVKGEFQATTDHTRYPGDSVGSVGC